MKERPKWKYVKLTNGKRAMVDSQDYPRVSQLTWYAWKSKSSGWYAARVTGAKPRKRIPLQNFVLGCKGIVDHCNFNGLDNRRQNLRKATKRQNAINRRPQGASKFKGVSWHKLAWLRAGGRWEVMITNNWRRIYLGSFKTELEAARAYNRAAKRLHGRFAWLNPV